MFAKNVFIGKTGLVGNVVARTKANNGVIIRGNVGKWYKGCLNCVTNTVMAAKEVKIHYVVCIDREYVLENGGLHWDSDKKLKKFDNLSDAMTYVLEVFGQNHGHISFEVRA